MSTDSDQGFLQDIDVQSDFGLGEQSQFVTEEDTGPSQPYKLTTVQETIPAAPAIGVGGKFDPYSANDLSSIIHPFTDPESIKERRKKERKTRGQIKSYGGVAPLFADTPSLDITSPDIPIIKYPEVPDPKIQMESFGVKPELVRQIEQYDSPAVFYEPMFKKDKNVAADVEKSFEQAEGTFDMAEGIKGTIEGAYEAGSKAYDWLVGSGAYTGPYGAAFASTLSTPSQIAAANAFNSTTGIYGGVGTQTGLAPFTAPASQGFQNLGRGTGMGVPGGTGAGASSALMSSALKYGGTALSAYSAFDAFKQGDMLGGAAGTAQTLLGLQSIGMIGSIPGLQTVAIALTALNFVSSITGWGRGKPKPGFGGSEIGLRQDGTFFHDQAYSYNGFDPSGAKKHTDMAMKFLTNYEKELGLKINYERAQKAITEAKVRGGNYLRRVDVSPWKDGSGSASEMIERWLSAGVYDGTPTYYDAYTGQREAFQTQQQYEQWMQNFSHRMFS